MTELVLAHASLIEGPDLREVDILVEAGMIMAIVEPGFGTGAAVHDLSGMLVMPSFADPHAHLDKALTGSRIANPTGDLIGAIDAWVAAVPRISTEDIVARATEAIELYVANGVTAIRTHSDIGEEIGMRSVEALTAVRADTDIDLQVCGLVMWPLSGADGAANRALLAEAIERGIDLIGGAPSLDPDPVAAIGVTLDMATDAGLPLDLHIDETLNPEVMSLQTLARSVIERGFPHQVTAGHCVSLGMQSPATQRETALLVAEAGITVVTNPQTNLFLQGWDIETATPRGLTAIGALIGAGVTVGAGGDNVQDPFNPIGRGDPIETASLLVAAGHLVPDQALAAVAGQARRVMGLSEAVSVGAPADLVALDAPSGAVAIASGAPTRRTYRQGRLLATTERVVNRFRG